MLLKASLIASKGIICDWSDQELQTKWLENLGIEGSSVPSFGLLHYEDNPLKNLKRSQNHYKEKYLFSSNMARNNFQYRTSNWFYGFKC